MSQPVGESGHQSGRQAGHHGNHAEAGTAAAKAAAVALWVIVGGALAYGVSQTAIRAAQLFT